MGFSLKKAREQGIAAGREWFEAVAEPYLRRAASGENAETVASEMEAEVEREILWRVQAGALDLRRAGRTPSQVEEWAKGVTLGAGWRAKEVATQIGAAND